MIQTSTPAIGGPQQGVYPGFEFPWRLHEMLTFVRSEGRESSLASWQPHGKAFLVHNQELFTATIMPRFFKQTKYESFWRKLHFWGFTRITEGEDKGAFYHQHFLRDQPDICRHICRVKIKAQRVKKKGQIEEDIHGTGAVELLPEPWAATQHENLNRSAENARLLSMMQRWQDRSQFPWKLHKMLAFVRSKGLESIVSWQPHGKAFRVHNREKFTAAIMQRFFKQTKYESFRRQLHFWGFKRITKGEDKGAFYHQHFLCGQPDICWCICVRRRGRGGLKKTFMKQVLLSFFQNLGLLQNMNSFSMLIAML
jgi:hypothetical protein